MKPVVYKLFVQAYLKKYFPYKCKESTAVFRIITSHNDDIKLDVRFLDYTVRLIDFYIERVNKNNVEEINESLRLIFRFIEIGYARDFRGVRNLYRSFTDPKMQSNNNRRFIEINPTITRIVKRKVKVEKSIKKGV